MTGDGGDDRDVDELVDILGLRAEHPSPGSSAWTARVPPQRSAAPAPSPPTGREAAVALVAALRRRRRRAADATAPEGANAVLPTLAAAVHRLRVLGRTEAVARAMCDEVAAVTGIARVAVSAPAPDGTWRILHATGGGTGPPAGLPRPDDTDPTLDTSPGSAAATAIASGRPASADSATGPAHAPGTGRHASHVVVPFPRAEGVFALLHAQHEPPRPVDDREVAALAAVVAVIAPLWHGSAVAHRWEQRAAAVSDLVAGTLDDALVGHAGFPTDEEDEHGEHGDDESWRDEHEAGGLPTETLTPREQVVLSHLLAGAANREIADALVLSVDTVKTHVKHILRKLGVGNRAELISATYRRSAPG